MKKAMTNVLEHSDGGDAEDESGIENADIMERCRRCRSTGNLGHDESALP